MDTIALLSPKIKELSFQIMNDGSERNWKHVSEGLREMAYLCKTCGLKAGDFLEIRKELIQAIEKFEPLAKTHIELAERSKHDTIH